MKVRHADARPEKIELQMTPMIDIVFQLLIFFVMTFKIVLPEGDFNIKMPKSAPAAAPDVSVQLPPVKVRLAADRNGTLAGIEMNEIVLSGFGGLHQKLKELVGPARGPARWPNRPKSSSIATITSIINT